MKLSNQPKIWSKWLTSKSTQSQAAKSLKKRKLRSRVHLNLFKSTQRLQSRLKLKQAKIRLLNLCLLLRLMRTPRQPVALHPISMLRWPNKSRMTTTRTMRKLTWSRMFQKLKMKSPSKSKSLQAISSAKQISWQRKRKARKRSTRSWTSIFLKWDSAAQTWSSRRFSSSISLSS